MIQEYQYIYEIYKERSFTKAARNLFISQPSLSASVKKIESQLGYKIFDRSSSKLALTQEGKYYIDAAIKILSAEADLKASIEDLAHMDTGSLIISGATLFSTCVFPFIIKSFSALYPKISVNFYEADSVLLYDKALKANVDLIIDAGKYDHEYFETQSLFEENILLAIPCNASFPLSPALAEAGLTAEDVMHQKHLEEDCPCVSPGQFSDYPFMLLEEGHDMHDRALSIFDEAGITPLCNIYLNQLMTAFHMAAKGLGCTFVTDTLVKYSYSNAPLTYFKLKTENPDLTHREVFVAYRKSCHLTHAMRKFIEISQQPDIYV